MSTKCVSTTDSYNASVRTGNCYEITIFKLQIPLPFQKENVCASYFRRQLPFLGKRNDNIE